MADMKSLMNLLWMMYDQKSSDLHIGVGRKPYFRVDGRLFPVDLPELLEQDVEDVSRILLGPKREFLIDEQNEIDFSFAPVDYPGRFRCNFYRQKGTIALALRLVTYDIPQFQELNLPEAIKKAAHSERGIVLITGTTGSGKSTTLACMTDMMNEERDAHILTIEDPIEFYHFDKKCIMNQREIGIDTDNFNTALRASLREDPDVILVGEMRDRETIQTAMTAAITGHLVMSTLHTTDVVQTINRIIDYYPADMHQQARIMLAETIEWIFSMRLLPRTGGGRLPAMEIMKATARIREFVQTPEETYLIKSAMEEGRYDDMITFDQYLLELYRAGLISYNTALRAATSEHDFKLLDRSTTEYDAPITQTYSGGMSK